MFTSSSGTIAKNPLYVIVAAEVAILIVGALLQHRERKAQPAMPLLEAIEGCAPPRANLFTAEP